jgi:hypothetical protein
MISRREFNVVGICATIENGRTRNPFVKMPIPDWPRILTVVKQKKTEEKIYTSSEVS